MVLRLGVPTGKVGWHINYSPGASAFAGCNGGDSVHLKPTGTGCCTTASELGVGGRGRMFSGQPALAVVVRSCLLQRHLAADCEEGGEGGAGVRKREKGMVS